MGNSCVERWIASRTTDAEPTRSGPDAFGPPNAPPTPVLMPRRQACSTVRLTPDSGPKTDVFFEILNTRLTVLPQDQLDTPAIKWRERPPIYRLCLKVLRAHREVMMENQ
jgi:hypothetical protein